MARLALVGYDFQLPRLHTLLARLPPCETLALDLRDDGFAAALAAFRPTAVVQYGSETTDPPRAELNRRYRLAPTLAPTFFAENAWLPQSGHLYLDPRGVADQSAFAALPAAALDEPAEPDEAGEAAYRAALAAYRRHAAAATEPAGRERYTLLCLQIPDDTVVQRASPLQDMQAVIDLLETRLPGGPLVIRPHPLDPREYRARRAAIHRDGSVGEWLRRADSVVACNSTTLVEAVAWETPTIALGRGIFTGKGVCDEYHGRLDRLGREAAPRFDAGAARRFLWAALRRQIPLDERFPDLTRFNPVLPRLRRLLTCAS